MFRVSLGNLGAKECGNLFVKPMYYFTRGIEVTIFLQQIQQSRAYFDGHYRHSMSGSERHRLPLQKLDAASETPPKSSIMVWRMRSRALMPVERLDGRGAAGLAHEV